MAKWSVVVWAAVTADLKTMIDLDLREADIALRNVADVDVDIYCQDEWHGPVEHRSWRNTQQDPLELLEQPFGIVDALAAKNWREADHRMLVLWGHGGRAFPASILTSARQDLLQVLGGLKLNRAIEMAAVMAMPDIVGYDACRMASLENVLALAAGELAANGTIFVGSVVPEPASGWPYFESLQLLTGPWSSDPQAVASGLVEAYAAAVDTPDWSMVALDLGKVPDLREAWTMFLNTPLPPHVLGVPSIGEQLFAAAAGADIPDDLNLADLGALMERLARLKLTPQITENARRVRASLLNAIITRRDGGQLAGRDGISVHLELPPIPTAPSWHSYFDEFSLASWTYP